MFGYFIRLNLLKMQQEKLLSLIEKLNIKNCFYVWKWSSSIKKAKREIYIKNGFLYLNFHLNFHLIN